MTFEIPRRFTIAAIALSISAVLLRSQMSSALVLRGDDLAYRGNSHRALVMYRRALAFDSQNAVAVDRLAFTETITHRPGLVADAVRVATRYLNHHPDDATVLADRALASQILRRYGDAARDFAIAARITGDAQTATFAGFAALHAGNRAGARRLFTRARAVDPSFAPAMRGLRATS